MATTKLGHATDEDERQSLRCSRVPSAVPSGYCQQPQGPPDPASSLCSGETYIQFFRCQLHAGLDFRQRNRLIAKQFLDLGVGMIDEKIDLGLSALDIPSLLWLVRDGIEQVKNSRDPSLNYALGIEDRLHRLGYSPAPIFHRDEIRVMIELLEIGKDRNLDTIENTDRTPGLIQRVNLVKSKLEALV